MDKTDEFIDCLFNHYINNDIKYLDKAKKLVEFTPFKGWPDDKKQFWNAESFVWKLKIEKALRELINKEIEPYTYKNNLSLGSGSEPYVDSALYIDISPMMLERIKGKTLQLDLEKDELPDEKFDSCTCIFLLNYLKNWENLVLKIKEKLKKKAYLVVVNSIVAKNYKHLENKDFDIKKLHKILEKSFEVKHKKVEFKNIPIDFFFCKKE